MLISEFDGTLVDTRKNITASVNYVRWSRHRLKPLSSEEASTVLNGTASNSGKFLFGEEYGPDDSILFKEHYEHQCVTDEDFYPGILDALHQLLSADFRLAIATNGSTRFPLRILKHLDADKCFDTIIGADKVASPKPSPDMIRHIIRSLRHTPSPVNTWLLGDSPNDMLAAQNAGITGLFASWGYSTPASSFTIVETPSLLPLILSA